MMAPGEDKIVADRIHAILSAPRPTNESKPPAAAAADLTGRWDVHLEFAAGASDETLYVKQEGNQIAGTHQGAFVTRDCHGTIAGDEVMIASSIGEVHGAALSYHFTGKLDGDTLSGALNMGEYLDGKWTAKKHVFGRQGRGEG